MKCLALERPAKLAPLNLKRSERRGGLFFVIRTCVDILVDSMFESSKNVTIHSPKFKQLLLHWPATRGVTYKWLAECYILKTKIKKEELGTKTL